MLRAVTFRYRRSFALGPIALSVTGPGVIALMGPNGAGKSTLVRLVCGLATPTTGSVSVDGLPVSPGRSGRAAKQRLGYVPQVMAFPPRARVEQVLHHAAWLRRVSSEQRVDAVRSALAVVDLTDRARSPVGSLSGGMVRRLAVAQALVHDPSVLVLDEPTAGLDPQQRLRMRSYLSALGERSTVLVATHLAEDVEAIADRVVVMAAGRLLFDGDVDQLVARGPGASRGMSAMDAALAVTLGEHPDERAAS